MSNKSDNLKKAAFGVMVILFVINISTMADADREQTTELDIPRTNVDGNLKSGMKFSSTTDEIESLRITASELQATQQELLEEIGRLESKIHAFESQKYSITVDQSQNNASSSPERP